VTETGKPFFLPLPTGRPPGGSKRQAAGPFKASHDYVLVNNRSEGNAPLTVQALTDMLQTD